MKKIEELLPQVIPAGSNSPPLRPAIHQNPFARIGLVPSDSFAFKSVITKKNIFSLMSFRVFAVMT